MNQTPRPAPASRRRDLATRLGHDAVWLLIAALFCVVELAVLVTDASPLRWLRRACRARINLPSRLSAATPGAAASAAIATRARG